MLSAFANTFKIPELRKKILFTLGLIFACRFVANVPTPGVDAAALQEAVQRLAGATGGGGLFGLADLFSGGALQRFSVGALGIMPYISASIILQLMTAVVPALERLAREGDVGRQKLTQYTRYLTLLICAVQSFSLARLAQNPAALLPTGDIQIVAPGMSGLSFELLTILSMTVGTFFVMWLGEQISLNGIGNGISLIITVNIVSRLPQAIAVMKDMFMSGDGRFNPFHLAGLIFMLFTVIAATVAVTQAQRKIPIHTTKRVVGRKVYARQNTFMPLRINYSGVMPIIFASAILQFPPLILSRLPESWSWAKAAASSMQPGSGLYLGLFGVLILFFAYFWVATQFNPIQIADDLKKQGGYVPGIRPGRPTAEFLDRTMTRLTLAGALFLTVIAVLPMLMSSYFHIPYIVSQFFGGTGILIIVGVMLDTMRQIESHLLMRHYDGFLKKGKLRGRKR